MISRSVFQNGLDNITALVDLEGNTTNVVLLQAHSFLYTLITKWCKVEDIELPLHGKPISKGQIIK